MTTPAAVDLGALFDGATQSVVRVETLQQYNAPGEREAIAAWRRGAPRPVRSVRTNSYLRRVAAAVARGVTWERLRVIDFPPTEYQQWELQGYIESQAVGELVTIAQRHDLYRDVREDVWIIDGACVAMDYDLNGGFVGSYYLHEQNDPAALDLVDEIRAAGIPLNEYLAIGGARAS